MKRTRIHVFHTAIDSNYAAHKGYIPIPSNVRNIKSICPVLRNAEGYISLLKEMDEEQILNEMRIEDSVQHINTRKVDVDVTPGSSDFKYVLRLTKIINDRRVTGKRRSAKVEYNSNGMTYYKYHYVADDGFISMQDDYRGTEFTTDIGTHYTLMFPDDAPSFNIYDTTCTLKLIIEYEEDYDDVQP